MQNATGPFGISVAHAHGPADGDADPVDLAAVLGEDLRSVQYILCSYIILQKRTKVNCDCARM